MDPLMIEETYCDCNEINTIIECETKIGFFPTFLIVLGLVECGLLFGLLIVSQFMNSTLPHMFDGDTCEATNIKIDVPYDKKYPITREKYKDTSKIVKNTYMYDQTPDGGVFMSYDVDEEGFLYWSDHNIRFSYLETVARKYVDMFHCTNVYIERECNKVEPTDNEYESDDDSSSDYTDSDCETDDNDTVISYGSENSVNDDEPFATFKTYNSGNTNQKNTKPTVQLTGCKFIKRGKINDFSTLQMNAHKKEVPEKEKITFDMFRKMFFDSGSKDKKI